MRIKTVSCIKLVLYIAGINMNMQLVWPDYRHHPMMGVVNLKLDPTDT